MAAKLHSKESGGGGLAWILLFSLVVPGLQISLGGRTPSVLPVDVSLVLILTWLILKTTLGTFWFDLSDSSLLYLVSAYTLANLASTLFSLKDVGRSIVAIEVFVFGFMTYLIVLSTVRSMQAVTRVLYGMTLWSGIVGIMLIHVFISQWQPNMEKADVELSFGRSNYLASMLVPLIPVTISLLVTERGILKRAFIGLNVLASLLGLLITMSRGALTSLTVVSACALPLFFKAGLKTKHLLAALAVLALFIFSVPTEVVNTDYQLFATRIDNVDYGRLDLWRVAWSTFLENPIWGVGPNCVYIYNDRVMPFAVLHTHNFVLNNLAEVGLVGSIPFFLIVGLLVKRSYRLVVDTACARRENMLALGILIGLLATLAHGMVEPTFPGAEYSTVFWTLMGAMASLRVAAGLTAANRSEVVHAGEHRFA